MFNYFENKRKEKFKNQLKYGQDKKPEYNRQGLVDALAVGDEDKAQEIMHELVKRHALTGKLGK